MEYVKQPTQLVLAGEFSEQIFKKTTTEKPVWDRVIEKGWLDRKGVSSVLSDSVAGLVTLHPIINYLDALPIKMFEYMGAGIPVIASNFPLWKTIIENNSCGICVDPLDPKEIAESINFIISNPEKAELMGRHGQQAVKEKYNWDIEEKKLFNFYLSVINR